ncbi:MAG: carbohydrate kinase, partial [Fibrobacteria bacterium]|nr:carbohydrate kinase [Fibrobacteria bacterium]
IGQKKCLEKLFNLPGNFTASKLAWVKEYEPKIYTKIDKFMLPGEYIAMKMSDEIYTTPSGLSEGMFWDYQNSGIATEILDAFGFSKELVPEVIPNFSGGSQLTKEAAGELGLQAGIPISYRGGDQPNNALSLNVLQPGEAAVTAGTSGVVYGVCDKGSYDRLSRVNTFVHVNNNEENHRYGVLGCLNGAGILNCWLKRNLFSASAGVSYDEMNKLAGNVEPGSGGVLVFPFGNGAERLLNNNNPGASIRNWDFNRHGREYILRAAQEGIVYAMYYGLEVMRAMGLSVHKLRAGHANMFLSPVFAEVFASVTGASLELFETDGAQGAARGAGIGAGIYKSEQEAFAGLRPVRSIEPNTKLTGVYEEAYGNWKEILEKEMLITNN